MREYLTGTIYRGGREAIAALVSIPFRSEKEIVMVAGPWEFKKEIPTGSWTVNGIMLDRKLEKILDNILKKRDKIFTI